MQTPRTKGKIVENLGLLITYLEKRYGQPVDEDTKQILFNALDWTADDVRSQDDEEYGIQR